MLKVKLTLDYRASKLRLAIILLATLFGMLLFTVVVAVASFYKRWGYTILKQMSIELDTADLDSVRVRMKASFDNRAPMAVFAKRVHCFFIVDATRTGETRVPSNFAVGSSNLHQDIRPGDFELFTSGAVQPVDAKSLGFLLQNLIEARTDAPITYFFHFNFTFSLFGRSYDMLYSQTATPPIGKSFPAVYFRVEFVHKQGVSRIIDTSKDIFKKTNLVLLPGRHCRIKVLLLFKFYHFRMQVKDIETDLETFLGKSLEPLGVNTRYNRKWLNETRKENNKYKYITNIKVKVIDVAPIKGTVPDSFDETEAFNNRLLVIVENVPVENRGKKESGDLGYTRVIVNLIRDFFFLFKDFDKFVKFEATETIEKHYEQVRRDQGQLALFLGELGVLSVEIVKTPDHVTKWNEYSKRFLLEEMWDENYYNR